MPDRHWRDGLHQAVEAKEGVPINMAERPRGPDHVPELLPALQRSSPGMTGTLLPNFWELRQVYRRVDDLRADQQADQPRRACRTASSRPRTRSSTRWCRRRRELLAAGRPVLIGTRSVETSKKLSAKLTAARHHAPGAQRRAERGRGRDRRAGRAAGRGDDRDEHGRPRHRHQARRRASPRPAAARRSAPSGTRRSGSTGSWSAAPAGRATPARASSSSRSKTSCSKDWARKRQHELAALGRARREPRTGTRTPRCSASPSGASRSGTTASAST